MDRIVVSAPGFTWRIASGQQWALTGGDGRLKTRLCEWLAGAVPPRGTRVTFSDEVADRVQIVSFAQQREAAQRGGFLQARYHSIVDEAGPGDTVEEFLAFEKIFDVNPFEVGRPLRAERAAYKRAFRRVVRLLNLGELLDRDFLALSNGETRRTLLARALLANPLVLVLDDPCAGLDPDRREQFKKICDALAARDITLVMAVRHPDEMPSCITRVGVVEKGTLRVRARSVRGTGPVRAVPAKGASFAGKVAAKPSDPSSVRKPVVALRDISISFGKRVLFRNFTWIVGQGEHWVLRGANGSGKTTLLSLITGDNPQAYANDVTVFGLKRGPGVELARIRRRIGMVSPEQQAYLGLSAQELLEAALKRKPALLLLDEPCLNLDEGEAARLKRRIAAWLGAHPACTAICVAHRAEDIPPGFTHELALSM